jgi:hypothetical protein
LIALILTSVFIFIHYQADSANQQSNLISSSLAFD